MIVLVRLLPSCTLTLEADYFRDAGGAVGDWKGGDAGLSVREVERGEGVEEGRGHGSRCWRGMSGTRWEEFVAASFTRF